MRCHSHTQADKSIKCDVPWDLEYFRFQNIIDK